MFVQTVMLAAQVRGLATCPQVSFVRYQPVVAELLGFAADELVTCGLSCGYADEQAAVNRWNMPREPLDQFTRWLGFDSPGGEPSFMSLTLTTPGWVMLCSDGLWNYCSEATELRELVYAKVSEVGDNPLDIATALVDWANNQGGHDNVTTALARAGGAP